VSELYLIAHSVRGEAAFDVAEKMECPHCVEGIDQVIYGCLECDQLGYWWIIPTSGHRAYPYWFVNLLDIDDTYELSLNCTSPLVEHPPAMPPGWPDHYKVGPAPKLDIKALFKTTQPPQPRIARRL
jgi:hypothetical protein